MSSMRLRGAGLLVALLLLTGCAAGAPVGFRIEAGHLRHRPSTSRDRPAPAVVETEACGEGSEDTEAPAAPTVRLELSIGESLAFTPKPSPTPVRLSEEALRDALARWVLDVPLPVRSALSDSSVVRASAGDAARVDRAFQRWGLWCQAGQSPREDGCLSLLEQGFSLAEYERVQLAVSFSLDTVMEGVDAAVRDTFSPSDPANRVFIQGHKGPHPRAYHQEVFRRLNDAMKGCSTTAQCRQALTGELQRLARDVSKVGSRLNKLVSPSTGP